MRIPDPTKKEEKGKKEKEYMREKEREKRSFFGPGPALQPAPSRR